MGRSRTKLKTGLLGLALLLAAGPGLAVDGVLEINASCASQGCFPGDDPAFPVQITNPGSYRLTGNLILSSKNISAVSITSDQVTLDLNGFTVDYCPTGGLCAFGPATAISATSHKGVTVRNGTILRAGGTGVSVGSGGLLENLYVGLSDRGVSAGEGSRVVRVTAEDNADHGITVGTGSIVLNSVSRNNEGAGVSVSSGVLIVDSVIHFNDGAFSSSSFHNSIKGGYQGCLISGNGTPISTEEQPTSTQMRNLGDNICGTDSNCP
jgi:hypothetical protein